MLTTREQPSEDAQARRDLLRALEPRRLLTDAGLVPDAHQLAVLESDARRQLLCWTRQAGKSTCAAALALHRAIYRPGSLSLLVAPAQRQSAELFRKVLDLHHGMEGLERPALESALRLELRNRSRIIALPASESTIRGYSNPDLVVIDEAAFLGDSTVAALLPAMARGSGTLMCVSTPNGRSGWFYEAWHNDDQWEKSFITWKDVPHIREENVQFYRKVQGEMAYRQEFLCEFLDQGEAVFPSAVIDEAFDDSVEAWAI